MIGVRKFIKYILPYGFVRYIQNTNTGNAESMTNKNSISNIQNYNNNIETQECLKNIKLNCINCSFDGYDDVYPEYSIVRCKKCNLVYSRKRKNDEELKNYYSYQYREYAKQENYNAVGVSDIAMKEFLSNGDKTFFYNIAKSYEALLKDWLLSKLSNISQKKFIEIGCSWGACLLAAKKLGFTPVGFEISRPNCELAAKLGLDVRNEEFSQADIQSSSASIVFFCHSFEHITTPNDYLHKAYDVLEEDGILFLAVPNFNSYWHHQTGRTWMWLDPTAHVAQYTGEVLCNMVKAAGFTIKECMTRSCDNEILDFALHEVDTTGNTLSQSDAKIFINHLEELNMGENLIVIAQKLHPVMTK